MESPDGAAASPVKRRRAKRLAQLAEADHRVPITWSLVGVQKAATSTLYRMLVRHPRVAGGPEKELRFFSDERRNWSDPDYSDYLRPTTSPQVDSAGDATPAYFFWPKALERMQRYRPEMRLIVTVRDPIERAMSQWSLQRDRSAEFPDVPTSIEQYATATLPDRLPAGTSPAQLSRQSLYTRGLYGQQLRRGLGLFPREQWLVLDFRDVTERPAATLDRVTDHLRLPRVRRHPKPVRMNATRSDHEGAPPRAVDLERLADIYADDLTDFAEQSGLDISSWPTWRLLQGNLSAEEFAAGLTRKLGLD